MLKLGTLSSTQFTDGDVLETFAEGMTLDELVETIKDSNASYVIAPRREGDTNYTYSRILSNLRQALWRDDIRVIGSVDGRGKDDIKEFVKWLDRHSFIGVWPCNIGPIRRGRVVWELQTEGKRWNQTQMLLAPACREDLDVWPFEVEWVSG